MNVLEFDKLIFHYEKLYRLFRGEPQFPIHAIVSLTNACNHRCLWCTAVEHLDGIHRRLNVDRLLLFLENAQKKGLRAISYIGNGEPTLYRQFHTVIERVAALSLEQGMFTNGFLLNRYADQILDSFTWVRVSLDAADQTLHDELHQVEGHFDQIIKNITDLVQNRLNRQPTIGVQYAVHQRNLFQLRDAAILAKSIGVDYFSIKPVFNRGSVGSRIEPNTLTDEDVNPLVRQISESLADDNFSVNYRKHQFESHRRGKNVLPYQRCWAGAFNVHLLEDERLIYCGPQKVSIGRLDDDLSQIESRIKKTAEDLDLNQCPAGCRYHGMNHLLFTLNDARSIRVEHANFI